MDFDTPVREIKGIGPKTEEFYHKLGMYRAEDVLYYYPRDYMKYDRPVTISDEMVSEVCFFCAKIAKQPLLRRTKGLQIVSATLLQGTNEISAVWFHMPFLTKSLKVGKEFIFRGTVSKRGMHYHVEQPIIYTLEHFKELENTLQPVYPLTKGLSNQSLVKTVKQVLAGINEFKDRDYIESLYGGIDNENDKHISKMEALQCIHFPESLDALIKARKRLVFEEFFFFILKLRMLKEENKQSMNSFNIIPTAYTKMLIESLPYRLTNAQQKVWAEIENDLSKGISMNRLIQGDVGSGKTIIAVLSAIMTGANGYQCAIMAPTEILATQHFEAITSLFSKYKIPLCCSLLTGSMTAKRKSEEYLRIESGEVQVIIGTHALIQEKVNYKSLALVITDEQHRFGVKQRERLRQKSQLGNVHTLVMSATPIPRTLAIIMYGDLDISIIDEVPARRLPIKNCVVNCDYRKSAYAFMEKEIDKGHQIYIICSLALESEGLDLENVVDYAAKLKGIFEHREDINIAYLHGKMKPNEKNRIMDAFYKNDIQILVSTTVVEVGVNVPNATVMLVENAERFGLAQLHQLRGRIGRGDSQSYCIFMSAKSDDKTMKRLNILNKSNDGFYIASEDLKQRGAGDMFGIRQSGDLEFKLGDVFNDSDMLKAASEAVKSILEDDPKLEKEINRSIREQLESQIDMIYSI